MPLPYAIPFTELPAVRDAFRLTIVGLTDRELLECRESLYVALETAEDAVLNRTAELRIVLRELQRRLTPPAGGEITNAPVGAPPP